MRAVVIAANGPAFCAGHDLKELTSRRTDADGDRGQQQRQHQQRREQPESQHAGPRREMTGRRESFHVDADLGEDDPGRLDMHPGNRAEPLQLSVEGAIQFLKLRLDPPDRLIESDDLVQLLTQQPTLRLAQ